MEPNGPRKDFLFTSESEDEIKQKLKNNIYKINFKSGKSKVWELFGPIETDTGEIIPNLVACKKCTRLFNQVQGTTSSLNRHTCYQRYKEETANQEIESETKKRLERLILKMTVKHSLPIDLVEDSDMKRFAECLLATGAKYGQNLDVDFLLPQPAATTKNLCILHADYAAKLRTEFKSMRNVGYGLTTAVWSGENLGTCLFLTMHYVKNGEIVNRFLGMESISGYKRTSEDIKLATEEILKRFDCTLVDKPILVTDNSDIMVGAFHENEHVYCMNRLLHRTLEEAIEETPDVKEIYEMTTKLFNFLKNFSKLFASPLSGSPTKRWITMLHLLSTNWNKAVKISVSQNGEESCFIEHLNLGDIKALIQVLEPFEEVSKELAADDGSTLHLVIVLAHRLKKICMQNIDDIEIIKKFKVNLLNFLEIYVCKNITLLHKVALYLFPPANKLVSFSESDKDLVRAECQRIMQTFVVDEAPATRIAYKVYQIDDENIQNHDEFCDDVEMFAPISARCIKKRIFEDLVETDESLNRAREQARDEMILYEVTNVALCDSFNLLKWWDAYKTQFPLLYKTSCKILATPATGAASEIAILKASSVIFENRSAVDTNPESVDELVFLHCNVRKSNKKCFMNENF